MLLSTLINDTGYDDFIGSSNVEINGLSSDSRQVAKNNLFIAVQGEKFDGHNYIPEAIENGAAAIVSNRKNEKILIPQVIIKNPRLYMSLLANKFYHKPSEKLNLIGVTGTNGKTTTTHMIDSIYKEAGVLSALIGTIGIKKEDSYQPATLTTMESINLQETLSDLVNDGYKMVSIEVSSHALAFHRVDYCDFDAGVFLNLTHDHLDFHYTMEDYLLTKAKLFKLLDASNKNNKIAVLNKDDNYIMKLEKMINSKIITFAIKDDTAQIRAKDIVTSDESQRFVLSSPEGEVPIHLPLIGRYNIYNALAASSVAYAKGIGLDVIKKGLEKMKPIPGRLESVKLAASHQIYIDYAHTPDALEQTLETLKKRPHERIILVFGCPGDRDKMKRPIMGSIAEDHCDLTVITANNPNSENTLDIIKDIQRGMKSKYIIIPDREEAVKHALSQAKDGDIVLLAGKGHENYQGMEAKNIYFSDRITVEDYYT